MDPCVVVILGATGDLTARKLIPALFNLYGTEMLPEPFSIVGCGRTAQDSGQFRSRMSEALQDSGVQDSEMLTGFVSRLHYQTLSDGTSGKQPRSGAVRQRDR
jgi:glucose-6-phosphate 1-dehydrogenase